MHRDPLISLPIPWWIVNLIIPRDVPNIRVNCKIFSCINSIRKNFNYNSVRKKKNWKILDEGCVMFPSLEGIQLSKATAITLPYSLLDLFLTRININLRYSPFSYYRFFSVHTVERCLNDSKLNGIALISHLFYTWTRGQFVNTFTIRSIHLFHSVFLFFFYLTNMAYIQLLLSCCDKSIDNAS